MTDHLVDFADVELCVGMRTISFQEAARFVGTYLNRRHREANSENPFAYPAYDDYPGSPGLDLGPQDLLAPDLLNVPLYGLRTYYALIDALPVLNDRLRFVPAHLELTDADNAVLEHAGEVYGVLDGDAAPFGVGMTTLAKIVHRKRPQLLPLWDDHIARCYLRSEEGDGHGIKRDQSRSWRDLVADWWLPAVQHDLDANREAWDALAGLTPAGWPAITPLRALDIVGWLLGGEA